jgi:hypothetical protein
LPFFMVIALASFISFLARHFMQYASTVHLLSGLTLIEEQLCPQYLLVA